jgi:hypothetical protein
MGINHRAQFRRGSTFFFRLGKGTFWSGHSYNYSHLFSMQQD